ncbi:MAG TPA: class I SAM-dependent methyltransferase [Methylomirabilota bacterium]|nr:class I SAM-dependent methyltransferase [Methylomirabilota bacterium]
MSDVRTAAAFATSWNTLPPGSVYTAEQFEDWMRPLGRADVEGRRVLELGCGNGSLLVHLARWVPAELVGVDLGASVRSARANLAGFARGRIEQADLVTFRERGFDLVCSIGVLHHLADPRAGFRAVVANTRPGGAFHCWVYAWEGNAVVRWLVEPLRRLACRLPWWLTKHAIAAPLALPFCLYAKTLAALPAALTSPLPLAAYCRWIARREFAFFRHVAFDQLVTPRTTYLRRATVETWLREEPAVDTPTVYVERRNGNSWKFGGRTRAAAGAAGAPATAVSG